MKSDNQKMQSIFVNTYSFIKKEGMFKNVLKCSKFPAEKGPHRLTKFHIANWCWDRGLNFVTEATFIKGGRCDLICLDLGVGFEVLSSEKTKDCDKKTYPLPIIKIPSNIKEKALRDILDDLLSMMGKNADYYVKRGI